MKTIKQSIVMIAIVFCIASCTDNSSKTDSVDSSSVSTDPGMGGSTDSGMTSSDSSDIRKPMADTSKRESSVSPSDSMR